MIEHKVTASAGGAAVSGFVVYLLSTFAYGGGVVPEPVIAFVAFCVTFLAGWLAPHTARFDPAMHPDLGTEAVVWTDEDDIEVESRAFGIR